MVEPVRFEVVLVHLDATPGSEIPTPRPCVVLSPDEMNVALRTAMVAPLTTRGHAYPWRVPVTFAGQSGRIALDQIHAVDRSRLAGRVGSLDAATARRILDVLAELFAP